MHNHLNQAMAWMATIFLLTGASIGQEIVAVSWSTSNAYVERIDVANSNRVFTGTTGYAALNAMAKGPSGSFFGADDSGNLITIDGATGAGTLVATIDLGGATISLPGMAFSPDGRLFVLNNSSPDDLYILDPQTGLGTRVGSTGRTALQGLTFGADGTLYGWDIGAGLFTLDQATGLATDVSPAIGANQDIQCLATGPDGTLYGAHRDLFTIDPSTGEATLLVDFGNAGIRGMEFDTGPLLRLTLTRQGGQGIFSWYAQSGSMYQIQQRPSLGPSDDWANVGPAIPGTDGQISRTNSVFQADQRFFRLRSLVSP